MSHCQHCTEMVTEPQGDTINRLFYEVHEGARVIQCKNCAQLYLAYFVECRDDSLQYFCSVSNDEASLLRDSSNKRELVRSLIGSRDVYFKSPWSSEWTSGGRVLVEARPW